MLAFGTENKEISPHAPFLLSMNDTEDNQLKIVIALPKRGEIGEGIDPEEYGNNDALKEMYMQSYPVYEDMDNVYQILFEDYIIYQCRNESYTAYGTHEVIKGKYLVIYDDSPFLNYYKDVIIDIDPEQIKSERKHYGIHTEFHVIDVISNHPPIITKYKSTNNNQY